MGARHVRISIIVVSGTGPVEVDGVIVYIAKLFDPMTVGDEILTRLEASSRGDSTQR